MLAWQFWTLMGFNALFALYVVSTLSAIANAAEKANQFLAMIYRHQTGN